MIKRILVGLADELHAAAATWHAIERARSHGTEVTALAILDVVRLGRVGYHPIGGGEAARQLRQYRIKVVRDIIDKAISKFEKECIAAGIKYRVRIEEG